MTSPDLVSDGWERIPELIYWMARTVSIDEFYSKLSPAAFYDTPNLAAYNSILNCWSNFPKAEPPTKIEEEVRPDPFHGAFSETGYFFREVEKLHNRGQWLTTDKTFTDLQHGLSPEWRKVVSLWREVKTNGYTIVANTLTKNTPEQLAVSAVAIWILVCGVSLIAWNVKKLWEMGRRK